MDKKISFLLPNLRGAGVEKVVINLANTMHSKGYSVDILLFKKEGANLELLNKNINIVELHSNRALFSLFKIAKYFKHNNTNMISSYNHTSIIAIIAKILSMNRHSKIFVCEHNNYTQISKLISPLKNKIITTLMAFLYPKADGVIAVSNGVATDLKKHINTKVKVLYNPVISKEIYNYSNIIPTHPWYSEFNNIPIFLNIGRLAPQKNQALLLKAFAKVTQKVDARLVILGDGELEHDLKNLTRALNIENNCYFAGYTQNPYSYIKHSDIFVLSSNFEGLPTVIIESLALNTPVVSTSCPSGPSEILEDGKWGTLVPTNNVEALAEAMLEQLKKPRPTNLKKRAEFFNVESTTERYIDYIFNQK